MQKDLWKIYESKWREFKNGDHIQSFAPIPPNCRALTLHIYMTQRNKTASDMKSIMDICMDYQCFKNCNNEAKRRLQMCAFQIIDKSIFLNMKEEINKSFNQLIKIDNEQIILELN